MISITDTKAVMKVNGLQCAFHMPAALVPRFRKKNSSGLWTAEDGEGEKGEEVVQNLPPGAPRYAFPVDEYKACPNSWMRGSDKESSYWLPVRNGCGMWIDMNYCYDHSRHVAAVVSIQGVNPITGTKTKLGMEQYKNCPKHDVPFGQDRFCEQCGYKWDGQNYLSTNCTPRGLFWIDGFRGDDGVVRQYVFTEETCKGVAASIIGEERVFAVGIAFYLSKEPKKVTSMDSSEKDFDFPEKIKWCSAQTNKNTRLYPSSGKGACAQPDLLYSKGADYCSADIKIRDANDFVAPSEVSADLRKFSPEEVECEMKKLEITAGARIKQRIYQDPEELSFWQPTPAGFIYINYCSLEDAEKIMRSGRVERSGSFLSAHGF